MIAFETDRFTVRIVPASARGPVDADVRAAQRLRFEVFADELGAKLPDRRGRLDEDAYDAWCDHLVVRDKATGGVVGTYRILRPMTARWLGYYADTEFLTSRLDRLKGNLIEFGRSCIHRDHRSGPVILLLWTALARFMVEGGYEHVIGCASVGVRDGGHEAASVFERLRRVHAASLEDQVVPRRPLPIERLTRTLDVEPPPLIKGYLRVGAQLCGAPAWDPAFDTADFFLLLSLARISPRYAKHFGLLEPAYVDRRQAA